MSSYDKEAIAAIADPEVVANYIGIETQRHGAYTFIRCPSHEKMLGKADTKIGNCIISNRGKKGFKCFACGAHGDVFDMVTAFMGCSYPEALKIVGDACGGANSFIEKQKGGFKKKPSVLSAEDLELIGLSHTYAVEKSDEGCLLYNVSSKKEKGTEKIGCIRRGDEFLLFQKTERANIRELKLHDPGNYYLLVERKAEEAVEKYQAALNDCDSKRSTLYKDLVILFSTDGKYSYHAELPEETIDKIKEALEKKRKRAEEILNECRKLAKQQ